MNWLGRLQVLRIVKSAVMVFAALLPACSGASFQLDPALAATPALPVEGPLGMNTARCDSDEEASQSARPLEGLAADEAAEARIGPLVARASAPHRSVTSEKLFSEAIVADYQRFVQEVRAGAGALGTGDPMPPAVVALLADLDTLLALPKTTTETLAFSLFAEYDGRLASAACIGTDTARLLGVFDPPNVSLSCRIVASDQPGAYELRVHGEGSWANYTYSGTLVGKSGKTLRLSSQSTTVLGAGGIRGFDLRTLAGDQLAALSFWHTRNGEAKAWLVADAPSRSVLSTTLAIAYVYPWPTGCDAQHLREQSTGDAS